MMPSYEYLTYPPDFDTLTKDSDPEPLIADAAKWFAENGGDCNRISRWSVVTPLGDGRTIAFRAPKKPQVAPS